MIAPHLDALELFRTTRADTHSLIRGLTQRQADFRANAQTWSIGQVLDHLLIAERLYREAIQDLIRLAKAGHRPVISKSFSEVDTSIAHIPRSVLPFLDVPFTVVNMFVPSFVREVMAEFRIVPAQNSKLAEPAFSTPVLELRDALRDSFDDTAALIKMTTGVDFRALRYQHPLLGDNNVPQLMRMVAYHEKRHQSQIRDNVNSRHYPKGA
ncbi:MAG: DinB family protein [Bryobacteraceae bacterium]